MTTSQPDPSQPSGPTGERATPDALLHARSDGEVSPEDVVLAAGKDITEHNLDWARRKLAAEGPAALDKLLP